MSAAIALIYNDWKDYFQEDIMKKKALSILLTAAMAVTLLAGCGSSSDNAGSTAASGDTTAESAAGSEAAAGSDKTVVNFYYSTDLEKVAQKEIEAFNTANSDIEGNDSRRFHRRRYLLGTYPCADGTVYRQRRFCKPCPLC